MNKRVSTIVVTGGPCAGKSNVMALLTERLSGAGFTVVTVPEGARDFRRDGLTPARLGNRAFQEQLLRFNIELENRYREAAMRMDAERVVLLFDRGALDARAYLEQHEFIMLIDALGGVKIPDLRENRYDAVVHLRTAALHAPQWYQTDAERTES